MPFKQQCWLTIFSPRTIGVDEANQGTAALSNLARAAPVLYLRDKDGDGQLFHVG